MWLMFSSKIIEKVYLILDRPSYIIMNTRGFNIIIIIIIIIISIFKEDNVFSITASLSYGPPVNTDIDYYQTFFGLVYFC